MTRKLKMAQWQWGKERGFLTAGGHVLRIVPRLPTGGRVDPKTHKIDGLQVVNASGPIEPLLTELKGRFVGKLYKEWLQANP